MSLALMYFNSQSRSDEAIEIGGEEEARWAVEGSGQGKEQENRWSLWYQIPSSKERWDCNIVLFAENICECLKHAMFFMFIWSFW